MTCGGFAASVRSVGWRPAPAALRRDASSAGWALPRVNNPGYSLGPSRPSAVNCEEGAERPMKQSGSPFEPPTRSDWQRLLRPLRHLAMNDRRGSTSGPRTHLTFSRGLAQASLLKEFKRPAILSAGPPGGLTGRPRSSTDRRTWRSDS